MNRIIGTTYIRVFTALFALLCVASVYLTLPGVSAAPPIHGSLRYVLGFLSLMGFVHCSRRIFDGWMALAERLNRFGTFVLFGAVYLVFVPLLVPLVRFLDPLQLRKSTRASFWEKRHQKTYDVKFFQRM